MYRRSDMGRCQMDREILLNGLPLPLARTVGPWIDAICIEPYPKGDRVRRHAQLGAASLRAWIQARISDELAISGAQLMTNQFADALDSLDRKPCCKREKPCQIWLLRSSHLDHMKSEPH